ncbi:MAG: hypothetical protein HY327_04330 [Chloroflexi bacterium]|nr:hypothetical protein [Chloroflexota bacterium]
MNIQFITSIIALVALIFSIVVFASRWQAMQRLPFGKDRSIPKDSAWKGIMYAFTLGMMPWAKESTRIHMLAYLRGIGFHIGIFAGLAALIASPWFENIPFAIRALFAVLTGSGALMGAAGGVMRVAEKNLRGISTRDDHAAVWLVSLWLGAMAFALIAPAFLPAMYVVSAAMLVYAPLGKIRHCIYFYFARLFYGLHIGRRGVASGLIEHSIPSGRRSHAPQFGGVGAASARLEQEAHNG